MDVAALKKRAPWWLKIALKIVLSRVPVPYRSWARLGIFKLGSMTDPAYALEIFRKHYERVSFPGKGSGFVCMELGPGDSLCTAPIARAHGAARSLLVDTGRYASDDLAPVRDLLDRLARETSPGDVSAVGRASTWDEILRLCGSEYFTGGISSLKRIPEGTVDFAFSNAVLEHVRLREFPELLRELRRVMRKGGAASHTVDLTDHLSGGLNNLRFEEATWEGRLFADSGFYTNRIRFSEMLEMMTSSGFRADHVEPKEWPAIPLPRGKMNAKFAALADRDLTTYGFEVVLRAI